MKDIFLKIIVGSVVLSSFGISQEPQSLTNLRGSYEREILKVDKKYIGALNKLKEDYIRSSNFEAVEFIQKEIDDIQQSELPRWVYGEWQVIGYKTPGDFFWNIRPNGTCTSGEYSADWIYTGNTLEITWLNGSVDRISIPSRESKAVESKRTNKGKKSELRLQRKKS